MLVKLGIFIKDAFTDCRSGRDVPLPLSDSLHLADWLQRLSDLAVSWEVLEPLIFQLAVIIAAFLLAWGFRAATWSWSAKP